MQSKEHFKAHPKPKARPSLKMPKDKVAKFVIPFGLKNTYDDARHIEIIDKKALVNNLSKSRAERFVGSLKLF